MNRLRGLGLRGRATLAFGLVGLFAAVLLATATYFVARTYLLDQREESAQRQAFADARLTRSGLRTSDPDIAGLLATIQSGPGSDVVLSLGGDWYSSSVAIGRDDVPPDLRTLVEDGHAGRVLDEDGEGRLRLVVGTRIAATQASYFEVFPLDELSSTLSTLRWILVVGAIMTSVVAALLGRFAAARIVQPLAPVADAARRIAAGDLDTRLVTHRDRDLAVLTESFNDMAAALEERVEREARFASDVSHELRSPLAALSAAIEVIDRRRAELPEVVMTTFDVLADRVRSFEELVLDLLEISRLDAGAVAADLEEVDIAEFLERLLAAQGVSDVPVALEPRSPRTVRVDRRRFAQSVGVIVDNARRYGGGLTNVRVIQGRHGVSILLDDAGPGIDATERRSVLQRFVRGTAGREAGGASGTGLGLALAQAQIDLHGGTITIGDSPEGGARVVIDLPDGSSER